MLLAAGAAAAPASAAPAANPAPGIEKTKHRADNLPDPLAEQEQEARKEAIAALLSGKAKLQKRNGSEVIQIKADRFVEYRQKPKVDPIFTILVEFGDKTDPRAGARSPSPTASTTAAPRTTTAPSGTPTTADSTTWTCSTARARSRCATST
ncbi:hypothetical protein [Micromonospora pattaloongensis]|uniref:hypothetical protein n=1 Tax=Micromonospora pattaloongensis TaxID=405436 RepID=UPI001FE0219B|nr:hypothetical protein [Micromonospora pattaloongensis]